MVKLFTSESVTEGHPDKVCDQISDAILDAYLEQDKKARVAVECLYKDDELIIAGEVSSTASVRVSEVALKTIFDIGYKVCDINVRGLISLQSPDIAQGVDPGGAGDQGLMFGYACDDTKTLMPAPIYYAHKLAKKLDSVRQSKLLDWMRPDGKTQVTFKYENDKPVSVDTIVVSTQHTEKVSQRDVHYAVNNLVIKRTIPEELINKDTKIYINPTGKFVIGGAEGDCGLTGRKIIVDTYGGMGRHGGGAFSGKDPSKVDRSAAYMARYLAKTLVKNGFAKRCEVQIAYAIGVAEPVSVNVNTFGTGKDDDEWMSNYLLKNYDLTPKAIIEKLDLLNVKYRKTAVYGHFGRDEFPWERV